MTFKRLFHAFAILLSVMAFSVPASALEENPPLLLPEMGMHSAGIVDAATDAEGRWLVTGSTDRTARVWSLADGRLLSILRPPSGNDGEGRINAVAMSRDGALIAIGGLTGRALSEDKTYAVYLYDRASGQMRSVLRGLKTAVTSLAMSNNGRLLAVGLANDAGVVLFSLPDGERLGADTAYRDDVSGLDFAVDASALVAASRDGEVRRYRISSEGLTREQRRLTNGGNEPRRVKFSPNGKLLAVGYTDSTQVMVLHAADLQPAWLPNNQGAERRNAQDIQTLSSVAWSADGNQLFAAGRWTRDRKAVMRRWQAAGQGAYSDQTVSSNTVSQLLPLADGRLIVAAADPGWSVLGADGQVLLSQASPLADLRARTLRVSHDGRQIGFTYGVGPMNAAFDVAAGMLQGNWPDLPPTLTTSTSLQLENWISQERPLLNKQALNLLRHDMARSAAVSADGKRVAIGGGSRIYLFDETGRRLWMSASYGTAWGIALTGDGRWLVAAFGDGTIRWYRNTDGAEVLKLFLHADRLRWVLSTPAGYFKASVGGEDLFGWSINRGADQSADFLPAGRFRETFQRADIVNNVLSADENAIAAGGATLPRLADLAPPVVSILSPGDGLETANSLVRLRVATRTLGTVSPSILKARVNGESVELQNMQLASPPGADLGRENIREFDVLVPRRDSTIAVFAENANGASSPAIITVKRPENALAADTAIAKPKLYVLAIGISDYPQADMKLDFAAKDARDFVAALTRNSKGLYRDVEVRVLTDAKARREAVLDGLEWLRRQATHRDVVALFIAGHGVNDADGTYYFLPYGADPDRLKRTGVIYHELRNTLSALPGKALFFIDTCHAGNVLGTGRRAAGGEMSGMINELASAENGVIVFSAATGRQYSLENRSWGNGAFTKALVDGLNGAADAQKTGRITHKMLDFYVSESVKKLTDGKQTPVTIIPQGVPDFPIALTARGK